MRVIGNSRSPITWDATLLTDDSLEKSHLGDAWCLKTAKESRTSDLCDLNTCKYDITISSPVVSYERKSHNILNKNMCNNDICSW